LNKREYNAAYDLISRNLLNNKDKIAFIDNHLKISYEEVYKNVQKFSLELKNLGLNQNDKIIICMHDSIYYPICFLGAIWSGIIPICINTMLPEKDYEYMLKDSEAKAVIFSSPLKKTFETLNNKLGKKLLLLSDLNNKNLINTISVETVLTKSVDINIEPAITFEDSVCFWLYSSGSTGSPKGTVHIHRSLVSTANTYAKSIIKIKSDDICFSAAKLFFAYGLGNAMTFPMSIGATSILMSDRPTLESVSDVINRHKVSIFFGVPTLYAAILNSNINKENYLSLRLSVSAGEALPAHLCEKWNNLLGIKVLDGIGSTEMLHIFISNSIEETIPGASGRPVQGYKARLIKDDGVEAKDSEIGELEINGPSSAISYWNKPEKTKVTFRGKWTRTGDKYVRDVNGIYTYCGRADDMMKVSGQYVSPFEVEAALQSHKSVLEAAVVAHKDKDNLIKPKAFIVLNTEMKINDDLEMELTNHVKQQLTPFKYPRWYEFCSELPKTATGKIQRYKLRENDE